MQGHRQNFVEVHINEILVNGKCFKAERAPKKPRPEGGEEARSEKGRKEDRSRGGIVKD